MKLGADGVSELFECDFGVAARSQRYGEAFEEPIVTKDSGFFRVRVK